MLEKAVILPFVQLDRQREHSMVWPIHAPSRSTPRDVYHPLQSNCGFGTIITDTEPMAFTSNVLRRQHCAHVIRT